MTDKKNDMDVLKIVEEALRAGKVRYSDHALERMEERLVSVFEV